MYKEKLERLEENAELAANNGFEPNSPQSMPHSDGEEFHQSSAPQFGENHQESPTVNFYSNLNEFSYTENN